MTPDVNVVIMDFPTSAKEMVVPNEDGSYTILINARLSNDGQLKAYEHAMKHIENDDFMKTNAQEIEFSAHNVVVPESAERISGDKFKEELLRIRRHRKKLKKQLAECERDMAFIMSYSNDYEMIQRTEEYRWLYGEF
jgi:hypothetical protein